jgi:hypothetical protein
VAAPEPWRGAAFHDGSSIGWQQAAPGHYPARSLRPARRGLIPFAQTYSNASNHSRSWVVPGNRLLATYRAAI